MQASSEPTVTAPPRNGLLEFLLACCTAGLYIALWFAFAARDLRRITGQSMTPVLWLFVPLLAIVQPFALPVFFKQLRRAEREVNIRHWPFWLDYVWMAGLFSCGLYFLLGEMTVTALITDVTVFFANMLWFLPLNMRMNRLRTRFDNQPLMERFHGYNPLEWLVVIVLLPASFIFYGYIVFDAI